MYIIGKYNLFCTRFRNKPGRIEITWWAFLCWSAASGNKLKFYNKFTYVVFNLQCQKQQPEEQKQALYQYCPLSHSCSTFTISNRSLHVNQVHEYQVIGVLDEWCSKCNECNINHKCFGISVEKSALHNITKKYDLRTGNVKFPV